MLTKPLVTIRCITYNHASYIEDAMNGFTIQQTDFPFVAVIIDDASTDGEPKVIKAYLNEHFDMTNARTWETDDAYFIEARHNENLNCTFAVVSLKYNFFQLKKSKEFLFIKWNGAKYISYCEGDDYWTSPKKLQMQVDFLESSTCCKFCHCKAKRFNQKTQDFIGFWGGNVSTLDDILISENVIPTLTTCYENEEYQRYLRLFNPSQYNWHLEDLPLFLWFAVHGGVHYIDENVGVYRILEESASHSRDPNKLSTFLMDVMNVKLLFDKQYNKSTRKNEIEDTFMRKLMPIYGARLKSMRKLISTFFSIHKKNRKDYIRFLGYSLRALVRL